MQNNTPIISDELLEIKTIKKKLEILRVKRTNIINNIHALENSVNECYSKLEKFNELEKEEIEDRIPPLFEQLKQIDNEWDKLLKQIKSIDKEISRKISNPPTYFLTGIDNIKF